MAKALKRMLRTEYKSPLGNMILAADDTALTGLWFEGQKYFLGALKGEQLASGENLVLRRTKEWLDAYFAGKRPEIHVSEPAGKQPEVHVAGGVGIASVSGQESPADRIDTVPVAFLDSEVPLNPMGTSFQRQVWQLLCEIPYGEVTTYKALAVKMAALMGRDSMSAQAVGGAVGHNPISVIIPCHRVLGSDGSLTGYAGGMEKKQQLLKQEGVIFK